MDTGRSLWPTSWLNAAKIWLKGKLRRRTVEWEIAEEFRFHLEMETKKQLQLGATPTEARERARESFGNRQQYEASCQRCYLGNTPKSSSLFFWRIDMWIQDLKFAGRTLSQNPLFTFVMVLTLALGIGANTTIFSVVNPLLLRPLPYDTPEHLVQLAHIDQRSGFDQSRISMNQYLDWKEQATSFSDLGLYTYGGGIITAEGIEPRSVNVGYVSSNMLTLLGVEPLTGRGFIPDDAEQGTERVVLLGHGLWQVSFGGDPNVVGQTITLDGRPHTIVGIMDRGFNFPYPEVRMWTPLVIERDSESRDILRYLAVGRLNSNVEKDGSLSEMQTIHARFSEVYPDVDGRFGVNVVPLRQGLLFFYSGVKLMMSLLMVAVGFVLLIVAANIAGVMLARAGGRTSEFAIRSVLGSSRLRLVRQLLTESAMLALLGGVGGSVLAYVVVGLVGNAVPDAFYRVGDVRVDGAALLFTLFVSLFAALLFGLTPALRSSKVDLSYSLKEGGRVGSGKRRGIIRNILVMGQVGKAVILLAGAAFMMRAFLAAQSVDLGFLPNQLATSGITLPTHKYPDANSRELFFRNSIERMEGIPGVLSAAGVSPLPLDFSTNMVNFHVDGNEVSETEEPEFANEMVVTPGFFATFGVQMLQGRDFNLQDNREAPNVVVINEVAANRYWPDKSPIGETISIVSDDGATELATVIGLVRDIRHRSVWGDEASIWPQLYFPFYQGRSRHLDLVFRTAGDPSAAFTAIKDEIRALDSELPLGSIRTMDQVVEQAIGPMRLISALLASFGGAALLLAAVGIYGIVACAVNQRRHEIGIRVALGAHPNAVVRLILKHGMVLTAVGIAVGSVLALVLVMALSSQADGGGALSDYAMVLFIAFGLGLVAAFASYLPARKAARIDPMNILKAE